MDRVTVTAENIDRAPDYCSASDQRDVLEPGWETWGIAYGRTRQRGQMSRSPDGVGAICLGADSEWGTWYGDVLVTGDGLRYGADGAELPHGTYHVDPGSMGDGWDDDHDAAADLVSVLEAAYARLGWEVDVQLGQGRTEAGASGYDARMAEEIDHVAEVAFGEFCGCEGSIAATLGGLVARGTIAAEVST